MLQKKDLNNIISIDKEVRNGKPCFRGTRVPVSTVIEYISKGWCLKDLGKIYPSVKQKDISSLFRYFSQQFT